MTKWGMIRLGASVEENALSTLEDLLGFQGTGDTTIDQLTGDSQHKPARADIQKYKSAYDLFNKTYDKDGGRTEAPVDPEAAQEWDDKYGLNATEKRIIEEYKRSWQVLDEDPQRAFTQTIRKLRSDSNQDGLHGLDDEELKRLVGRTLKKYEQQNYPMLYAAIRQALTLAYQNGPKESYKMWPRLVQWIKDRFQVYLWVLNGSYNPKNQNWTKLEEVGHYVDIATEGGALLSQLRAENKLPQNFDANQLSAGEFEQWLMDWKKANRDSEAQGQVVYEFHNGWTIQRLMTPEQLQYEGDEMGHCVGSYSSDVSSGSSVIYSLRDQKGEPHVTMEMEGMYVLKKYGDKPWHEMSEAEQSQLEHVMQGETDYGTYRPPSLYLHDDAETGDSFPYEKTYISPDDETEGYGKDNGEGVGPIKDKTFKIVQIQGQGNKTPKPEYQAMIKEFLIYLRGKGWTFERSDSWYGNWDDGHADGYDPEYEEKIDDARSLDNWWDDHYLPQHGLYRTQEGREDAYGMALPNERMRPGVGDWSEILTSIAGSLIEDYDQGKFRANWATAAQQVYHAWVSDMSKDDPDEQYLAQETKNMESEIEGVEEKIRDWEHENEWYALNDGGMRGEIAEKLKEQMEKKGEWDTFVKQLEAEHGELEDPEFDEYEPEDILEAAQEHDPDLYSEIIEEEITKWYSGDCYKFTQYLYMLVQKKGMVGPNDLPDPNQRHGGLPSYDELLNMDWKSEVNRLPTEPEIPGTFSHWHEVTSFDPNEIQIYPIDQERNVYFDEQGNQARRWRPGWVKNPESGKMEESGELEDNFLDNLGRQAEGYAAYHGDKPVASLTYVDDPAGWTMLGTAYTHPDYRQQGLFNRLAQPLRDSGRPIDAYVWNNPWLKNKVRDWRKPKSSKLGFFKVAADINELAQKARENLYDREDLATMGSRFLGADGSPLSGGGLSTTPYGAVENPKYDLDFFRAIKNTVDRLPAEAYKAYPWVVKQMKNQHKDPAGYPIWPDRNHLRDIMNQGWQHQEYLRAQPPTSPHAGQLPDINQMTWPEYEKWVYERNAMGIDPRPGYQWQYGTGEYGESSDDDDPGFEYPHEPQRQKWDVGDGWQVWPVWSEQDLKQEGDMMGHCVGGYCEGVHSGESAIFSLRDSKGEPHATIELEPYGVGGYNIVQVQGKQNGEPSDEYKARVARFFFDLQEAGHPVTWSISIDGSDDLDDYQYQGAISGDYGIPISADINVYNVCRELMDEAEGGWNNDDQLRSLDKLIDEGLADQRDVSNEIRNTGEALIENKATELAEAWRERKEQLEKEYEEEMSQDEDEESEEDYATGPEFEEWLENNYPDEYQQEYYGFTDAAEDELPEVVELMQRFSHVTWRAIA